MYLLCVKLSDMIKKFKIVFPFDSDACRLAMNLRGFLLQAGGEMVATQNIKIKSLQGNPKECLGGNGNLNPSLNKLPMMVPEIEITPKDIHTGSSPVQPTNFKRVLVQNYSLSDRLSRANNSEVALSAFLLKVMALCYISQPLTVNFQLKGENRNTPNGWGYLGIGSQYMG